MTQRAVLEESDPRRFWRFAAFAAACVLAGVAYVAFAALRGGSPHAPEPEKSGVSHPPVTTADAGVDPNLAWLRADPHIFYRSLAPGEYGRIVAASLSAIATRWVSPLSCDRAHFGRRWGICVRRIASSLGARVRVELIGADMIPRQHFEFDGIPSRARISPDERFAAVTLFVTGDDYEAEFSTRTKIFELDEGRLLPDIEFFDVQREGQAFQRIDFNYWGITFESDSRRAYATLGTGNTTYLVKADMEQSRVETLRENVECPSLSPSGGRIVYKKRVSAAGVWRLHVLTLASRREHALGAERRSVDDQVEWLDDEHVMYALPRGEAQPEQGTNLWLSPIEAAPREPARVFIEAAASPSVVR